MAASDSGTNSSAAAGDQDFVDASISGIGQQYSSTIRSGVTGAGVAGTAAMSDRQRRRLYSVSDMGTSSTDEGASEADMEMYSSGMDRHIAWEGADGAVPSGTAGHSLQVRVCCVQAGCMHG